MSKAWVYGATHCIESLKRGPGAMPCRSTIGVRARLSMQHIPDTGIGHDRIAFFLRDREHEVVAPEPSTRWKREWRLKVKNVRPTAPMTCPVNLGSLPNWCAAAKDAGGYKADVPLPLLSLRMSKIAQTSLAWSV
jgi:hypothetical protein